MEEPYPYLFMDSGPAIWLEPEGTARADAELFIWPMVSGLVVCQVRYVVARGDRSGQVTILDGIPPMVEEVA